MTMDILNATRPYAVTMKGASMAPRYWSGEAVLADPRRAPEAGHDVVVWLNAGCDSAPTAGALVGRLRGRTPVYLELELFNPPSTFRVPTETILAAHRAVRLAELLA